MNKPKTFHSFEFIGTVSGITKRILMDGQELHGVMSATICYVPNEVPRVFLEMVSDDVHIDEPKAEVVGYKQQEEHRKTYVEGKAEGGLE